MPVSLSCRCTLFRPLSPQPFDAVEQNRMIDVFDRIRKELFEHDHTLRLLVFEGLFDCLVFIELPCEHRRRIV